MDENTKVLLRAMELTDLEHAKKAAAEYIEKKKYTYKSDGEHMTLWNLLLVRKLVSLEEKFNALAKDNAEMLALLKELKEGPKTAAKKVAPVPGSLFGEPSKKTTPQP